MAWALILGVVVAFNVVLVATMATACAIHDWRVRRRWERAYDLPLEAGDA